MRLRDSRAFWFLLGALSVAAFCALCLTVGCQSLDYEKPLYQDDTGWQVWSCLSGEDIVAPYLEIRERRSKLPVQEYLLAQGPQEFFGFTLRIPDGVITRWGSDAVVRLSYVDKGDTLTTESIEYFFASSKYERRSLMFFGHDMYGPFPVPNEKHDLLSTSKGNVIVFVRFPLLNSPTTILSVEVENVLTREEA